MIGVVLFNLLNIQKMVLIILMLSWKEAVSKFSEDKVKQTKIKTN